MEGVFYGKPAVVFGFVVEGDFGLLCAAGVVEEDEVGGAVEFGGVDAVLGEDELDVGDVEVGFFFHVWLLFTGYWLPCFSFL